MVKIKTFRKKPLEIQAFQVNSLDKKTVEQIEEWIDDDDNVAYWGVSLCDPKVCSAILCNYSRLKQSG